MGKKAVVVLYVVLTIGPLLLGLGYSLLYSLGLLGLMNDGFTLEHWVRLGESGAWLSLLYSLVLTVVSLLLVLVLALQLSWWQVFHARARWLYRFLFVPLLFPPLIAGFAWFYLLSPAGILSRLTYQLGLIDSLEAFPRLVNDYWSVGILVTHVFLVFPLFALLFTEQARQERMLELREVALTLGSGQGPFFRRVYLPLLMQKSSPLIWLYAIFLLGTYEVPLLLGRSSPRVVTVFITDKLTRFNLADIPVGHAMAVIYTVLVLVVIRIFIRKENLRLI